MVSPDCQACDDSQSIFVLSLKNLQNFTLQDFKTKVLLAVPPLGAGISPKQMMIEFNSKMIYEFDEEMSESEDADEILMNQNRLKKTFEALGVQNLFSL